MAIARAIEAVENWATKVGLPTNENMRRAEEVLLQRLEDWKVKKSQGDESASFGFVDLIKTHDDGTFELVRQRTDPIVNGRLWRWRVLIGENDGGKLAINLITQQVKEKNQAWDKIKPQELKGMSRLLLLQTMVGI